MDISEVKGKVTIDVEDALHNIERVNIELRRLEASYWKYILTIVTLGMFLLGFAIGRAVA